MYSTRPIMPAPDQKPSETSSPQASEVGIPNLPSQPISSKATTLKPRRAPDITGKELTGHAASLIDLLWLGLGS